MEDQFSEYEGSLYRAHEELRKVQLSLPAGVVGSDEGDEREEALAAVIRDLETIMSDKFGLYVEA